MQFYVLIRPVPFFATSFKKTVELAEPPTGEIEGIAIQSVVGNVVTLAAYQPVLNSQGLLNESVNETLGRDGWVQV